ncbi:hypothetical protein L6164_021368 [Bauhinia variegata]|uniref:Uncharacterized protein n=1 Tax=Bauhinia variegata TaxID=167791 RepID=A0ACB9N018_BAUVA|nr:hypothetical protein L6164_021368 [Bauhinia variegata]
MEPPENAGLAFETAEKIVFRWDSTASEEAREKMIFEGDRHEVDRYLQAVDEIQRSMSSTSISDDQDKVISAIQIAMARLEDEFRNILITHICPIETDSLTDPSSSIHSASVAGGAEEVEDANGEEEDDASLSKEDGLLRFDSGASSASASYRIFA